MKQLGLLSPPPLRNLDGMQDPQQGTQTHHEVTGSIIPPPTPRNLDGMRDPQQGTQTWSNQKYYYSPCMEC